MDSNTPILIIEDDPMYRMLMQRGLTASDFSVELAENGSEALEILRQKSFRLVILDMNLPDMDGLEVLSKIRERLDSVQMPVILYSGGEDEQVTRALKEGANDYIYKSFDMEALTSCLDKHLLPND